MKLLRTEQETTISFSSADTMATVYTASKTVMRKLDKLVEQYPQYYRLTEQTEVSKTYSMPKSYVSYRKPRALSKEQREQKRVLMEKINKHDN